MNGFKAILNEVFDEKEVEIEMCDTKDNWKSLWDNLLRERERDQICGWSKSFTRPRVT